MATNDQAWMRVGALLTAAREAKGYKRRSVFARDLGLANDRVLYDIENAKRTNFDASTLAFVELAYGWRKGSIEAVLAGGEPTVTEENPRPEGEIDRSSVGDASDDGFVADGRRQPVPPDPELMAEIADAARRLAELVERMAPPRDPRT